MLLPEERLRGFEEILNRVLEHKKLSQNPIKKRVWENKWLFHKKEIIEEGDEIYMTMWYRDTLRNRGEEYIKKLKEEKKRFDIKYRGYRWKKEFSNLSEDVLLAKIETWFIIEWVEENFRGRIPWDIAHGQSPIELDMEIQAMKRGYYFDYDSDEDAFDGHPDAYWNIDGSVKPKKIIVNAVILPPLKLPIL